MMQELHLGVARPDRTRVRVVVEVVQEGGQLRSGPYYQGVDVHTPPVSAYVTRSRAALREYLAAVTRFKLDGSTVIVQAVESDARGIRTLLNLRDPLPDPIPIDLSDHD
jgi:hypothetical protein